MQDVLILMISNCYINFELISLCIFKINQHIKNVNFFHFDSHKQCSFTFVVLCIDFQQGVWQHQLSNEVSLVSQTEEQKFRAVQLNQ